MYKLIIRKRTEKGHELMKDFKKLQYSILHTEEYCHKKQKKATTYIIVKRCVGPLPIQRLQIREAEIMGNISQKKV